jgi:hypothetical protein
MGKEQMSLRFFCVLLLVFWLGLFEIQMSNGQEADLEDVEKRFAFLQLERDDLDQKKVSVLIEKFIMEESSSPDSRVAQVSSSRMFQRFVRDGNSSRERIDAVRFDGLGDQDVKKSLTEAQLIMKNKGIHCYGNASPEKMFLSFEVRSGFSKVQADTFRKHPFAIATTTATGNRLDGDIGSMLAALPKKGSIIEQKDLEDGRRFVKCYDSNFSAVGITFHKEEEWCVEQFETFIDRANKSPTMKSDPKDMKRYAITRTEWRNHPEFDQFLPYKVQTESDDHGKESWEVRFTDWKQGDDVDVSLLDEANFTEEKIRKSIDFQKVKNAFDQLPK